MEKIFIIGGGGHAKVVVSIIKKLGAFDIVGYTDNENRGTVLGVPYLGTDAVLQRLKQDHPHCAAVLGIGYFGRDDLRERLVGKLCRLEFSMPAVVASGAVVNEDVHIGEGTVVMDGVVINAGTRIGTYVIVNTCASVDHDCVLGDYAHIGPGVTLCGGVKVGARSLVGAGATVVQYKSIGAHCIVGAGSVVVNDCLQRGTYVGIPAKAIV